MRTSHAALNRLLDETDTSLTLTTLSRAATVLGGKIPYRAGELNLAIDDTVSVVSA